MTKKVDTWMPLLVDKYLGDTTHLTTELHGAYLLLLMSMWKFDGVLPADDEQLAPITKLPAARWRAVKPVLMKFFRPTVDGLGLTQKRLSEELQRSKASTEKRVGAGSKGAAARWQKDGNANSNANGTSDSKPDGKRIANGWQEGWQTVWQTGRSTPPPSPSETPGSSEPTARALVGMALKRAGVDMTKVNMADPRIDALIGRGATPEQWEGVAGEAVAQNVRKPLGWICTVLDGRLDEAVELQQGAGVAADPQAWRSTDAGSRAMAEQLGVEFRDDEDHTAWQRRLTRAWERAGSPAPAGATA